MHLQHLVAVVVYHLDGDLACDRRAKVPPGVVGLVALIYDLAWFLSRLAMRRTPVAADRRNRKARVNCAQGERSEFIWTILMMSSGSGPDPISLRIDASPRIAVHVHATEIG